MKRKPIQFEFGEKFKYKGFDVIVKAEYDEDPDFSWLGKYQSKSCCDNCIDRRERKSLERHTFEFFHPEGDCPEDREDNYRMMEEFLNGNRSMHVLVVSAFKAGVKLGSDSLGGVDDSYLKEAVHDHGMIDNAIREAMEKIVELCREEYRCP